MLVYRLILVTAIFLCALFSQPHVIFAFHCENPLYQGIGGYYCDGNQIFQDLTNCDDPDASHHKYYDSCKATEICVPDNPGDFTKFRTVSCVPQSGSGSSSGPSNPLPAGLTELEHIFRSFISAVVGLAFVALVILLVTAGFKYLTSGGEPKAVQSAHQTVTWALLGILFMAISWVVLQLISSFTGVEIVKTFDIRSLCGGSGFPFCKP